MLSARLCCFTRMPTPGPTQVATEPPIIQGPTTQTPSNTIGSFCLNRIGNHVAGAYRIFDVAITAQSQVQAFEIVDVTNRAVWSWTTSVHCCLSGPFHGARLKLLSVIFTWPYATSLCIPRVSFLCRTVVNSTAFECLILHNFLVKGPSRK